MEEIEIAMFEEAKIIEAGKITLSIFKKESDFTTAYNIFNLTAKNMV